MQTIQQVLWRLVLLGVPLSGNAGDVLSPEVDYKLTLGTPALFKKVMKERELFVYRG